MPDENNTILGYGQSGAGKSTNAAFAAKWMYERYRLPVGLISGETSSRTIFKPLIDVGIVWPLFMSRPTEPLVMLRNLSAGDWPMRNAGKLKWQRLQSGTLGGYIIEGTQTFSEMLLQDLRRKQRKISQEIVGKFEEGCDCGSTRHINPKDEESSIVHELDCRVEKFGAAAQSHYGFVQLEMLDLIRGFAGLKVPGRIVWTGHETEGKDKGKAIIGPALVGHAQTASIRKEVGMLLHFETYTQLVQPDGDLPRVSKRIRAWFVDHPDQTFANVTYPAKVTIPSNKLSRLKEAHPGGYFEPTPTGGLDLFLETESNLLSEASGELAAWKEAVDAKRSVADAAASSPGSDRK